MADTVSRPPGMVAEGVAAIRLAFARTPATSAEDRDSGADSKKARLASLLMQVPVALPDILVDTSGDGTLQPTDQAGPMTGYYWGVRRLTVGGFSAGTVTVYKNAVVQGGNVYGNSPYTFPQAGTLTFGRGEFLLRPDDFLVFAASGVTLVTGGYGVTIDGDADCFPSYLLPDYLI